MIIFFKIGLFFLSIMIFSLNLTFNDSHPTLDVVNLKTWKCRCGVVVKPVFPLIAIGWPCLTLSPSFTSEPLCFRWPYWENSPLLCCIVI